MMADDMVKVYDKDDDTDYKDKDDIDKKHLRWSWW